MLVLSSACLLMTIGSKLSIDIVNARLCMEIDVSSLQDETTSIGMKHFFFKHETFHATLCVLLIPNEKYTHRCMNQFLQCTSICTYQYGNQLTN